MYSEGHNSHDDTHEKDEVKENDRSSIKSTLLSDTTAARLMDVLATDVWDSCSIEEIWIYVPGSGRIHRYLWHSSTFSVCMRIYLLPLDGLQKDSSFFKGNRLYLQRFNLCWLHKGSMNIKKAQSAVCMTALVLHCVIYCPVLYIYTDVEMSCFAYPNCLEVWVRAQGQQCLDLKPQPS